MKKNVKIALIVIASLIVLGAINVLMNQKNDVATSQATIAKNETSKDYTLIDVHIQSRGIAPTARAGFVFIAEPDSLYMIREINRLSDEFYVKGIEGLHAKVIFFDIYVKNDPLSYEKTKKFIFSWTYPGKITQIM